MSNLLAAVRDLFDDREGKKAEECILAVIADLEGAGVQPEAIAKAMSRSMLVFCQEHGKFPDRYAWAAGIVDATAAALKSRVDGVRSAWVKKFMADTARTYRDARFAVRMDLAKKALQPDPVELNTAAPRGQA